MNIKKLDYTEPAVLRGIAGSVFGVLVSVGIIVPNDLPGKVDAAIMGGLAILPLVQAVWTRASVWSKRSHEVAVAVALQTPVEPDAAPTPDGEVDRVVYVNDEPGAHAEDRPATE